MTFIFRWPRHVRIFISKSTSQPCWYGSTHKMIVYIPRKSYQRKRLQAKRQLVEHGDNCSIANCRTKFHVIFGEILIYRGKLFAITVRPFLANPHLSEIESSVRQTAFIVRQSQHVHTFTNKRRWMSCRQRYLSDGLETKTHFSSTSDFPFILECLIPPVSNISEAVSVRVLLCWSE